MQLDFPKQILEKSSNIKFHENTELFNANGQIETGRAGGRTDRHMTKAAITFHNFCERARKKNTHFMYVALYIYTYMKQSDYEYTEIPIGR